MDILKSGVELAKLMEFMNIDCTDFLKFRVQPDRLDFIAF